MASDFRQLMTHAAGAGLLAGVVLFLVQLAFIRPLIQHAEMLEQQRMAHESVAAPHDHDAAAAPVRVEWTPSDGLERTAYTALGTVLTGLAFSAVFFGVASLLGVQLTVRRGVALGAAGFVCFALAPAVGLPPKPPGVAGAPLESAQVWWAATVLFSAVGLWLLTRPGASSAACAGALLVLAVPHLIGAPQAPPLSVPAVFAWRFALTSVATQGVFWILLGAMAGWWAARSAQRAAEPGSGVRAA